MTGCCLLRARRSFDDGRRWVACCHPRPNPWSRDEALAETSAVSIYYGSAKHTFRLGETVRFTGGGVWFTSVFDAGFRPGDRADIAFYDGTDMDIRLHNANGSYGPMTRYALAPIDGLVFPGVGQAAVGDLTGDGRPDLVLPNSANQPWSGVEVYADSKSGQLAKPVTYPTLDIPGQMTIADLTGNGRNDLIIEHDGMSGYLLAQVNWRMTNGQDSNLSCPTSGTSTLHNEHYRHMGEAPKRGVLPRLREVGESHLSRRTTWRKEAHSP